MANTTTWVDERYARRLGKQLFDGIARTDPRSVYKLDELRKSDMYLAEEKIKIGFGVGKPAIRVWCVDISTSKSLNIIYLLNFDFVNGLIAIDSTQKQPELAQITQHAYERMFLRLRTNDKTEVIGILKQLLALPAPENYGETIEISLDEGKFIAVSDQCHSPLKTGNQPVWVLKTFIGN